MPICRPLSSLQTDNLRGEELLLYVLKQITTAYETPVIIVRYRIVHRGNNINFSPTKRSGYCRIGRR